jgi:peptide chain release factor 2
MPDRRPLIHLPATDSALLAECVVDCFRASGPGGQHVNKTESAVRLHHLPSGIVVSDQTTRSQHRNRQNCMIKLREEVARRNYRPKKRKATRPSRSTQRKRREANQRHSQKKNDRRWRPE